MKTRFVQYIEERQSTLASGLAALLIITAGFLVFSYFSGLNKTKAPAITSVSTQSAQSTQNQNSTSTQPQANSANNSKTTATPTPSPTASKTTTATYTVTRGDSLAMIAQKYYQDASKWTVIASANNLANPSVIHVGNVLNIPNVTPQPAVAAAPQPSSTSISSTNTVKASAIYTVRSGDTLWSIAVKYYGTGFQWYRIDQANGTLARNAHGKPVVTAGQQLKIP
jgi:nucleoid-associated protein YgaU